MNSKMEMVEDLEIPVVGVEFLKAAASGGALLKISSCTISPWGAPRHSIDLDSEGGKSFKSNGEDREWGGWMEHEVGWGF